MSDRKDPVHMIVKIGTVVNGEPQNWIFDGARSTAAGITMDVDGRTWGGYSVEVLSSIAKAHEDTEITEQLREILKCNCGGNNYLNGRHYDDCATTAIPAIQALINSEANRRVVAELRSHPMPSPIDQQPITQRNTMPNKIDQLQSALDLLKDQDLDALKNALALIGEPVAQSAAPDATVPFEIGKAYFIRTVTLYQVGRVVAISGQFVKLEDASWIADTGRFSAALKSGEFSEIEPVGTSYINLSSIIDAFPFEHKLPSTVK